MRLRRYAKITSMAVPDETSPRRARGDRAVVGLVAGFSVLRILAIRFTPLVYVDSADYRHLDVLGGARRSFTVPLLYALMPSDGWRVVEQAAISALAWVVLALVVARDVADRRVRLAALATILSCGLTTQVTNWDSAILSDSITISLTVLLIAACMHLRRSPTPGAVTAAFGVTLLWTFARELHVYLVVIFAIVALIVAAVRRGAGRSLVLAAGLVVIAALGVAADRRNEDTANENLAGVIGGRILPDDSARSWFVAEGMPALTQFAPGQSVPREALQAVPSFERWVESQGLATYAHYLLTHPAAAITGPYGDLLEERATYAEPHSLRPVLLSPAEAYGRARPVLPPVLEDVLFDPGRTGSILALCALALIATASARSRLGADQRRLVPLLTLASVLPYVFLAWLGSVFEPGRHAMPGAVALRVGVLALLAVLADAWIAQREVDGA